MIPDDTLYALWLRKMDLNLLGRAYGMLPSFIENICKDRLRRDIDVMRRIERADREAKLAARKSRKDADAKRKAAIAAITAPKSRPIDMGGPRDVWDVWTPKMQAKEFAVLRGEG